MNTETTFRYIYFAANSATERSSIFLVDLLMRGHLLHPSSTNVTLLFSLILDCALMQYKQSLCLWHFATLGARSVVLHVAQHVRVKRFNSIARRLKIAHGAYERPRAPHIYFLAIHCEELSSFSKTRGN